MGSAPMKICAALSVLSTIAKDLRSVEDTSDRSIYYYSLEMLCRGIFSGEFMNISPSNQVPVAYYREERFMAASGFWHPCDL